MRRMAYRALLLVGCIASAEAAEAQSGFETIWSDLKTAPGDLWYVWSSPARVGSDDLGALALFTGGTLLVAVNDAAIQQAFRDHPNSVALHVLEPFRQRNGLLSELGRNHKIMRGAAAGYLIGLATGWDWLREASFGCALGNTANALPRSLTYELVSRTRPSGETDPYQFSVPGGDWSEHSFFGGHAANAFTCASFFTHRWDLGYAEPVVWVVAAGVAVGRTADEAHWASDTLVGIGFGWVIGHMIAERYEARDLEREADAGSGRSTLARVVAASAAAHGLRVAGLDARPIATRHGPAVLLSAGLRF